MTGGSNKVREIDLGNDFGDVVVIANGTRVKISAEGTLHGLPAPANDTSAKVKPALRIGDPDAGGVFVGKSKTTGKPLHAALADQPEYLTFREAFAAAEKMKKQPGRENAHVPTPEELDGNLYENRDKGALKGTFNTSGSYPGSCYRSSRYRRLQYFSRGGSHVYGNRDERLPVRLVW